MEEAYVENGKKPGELMKGREKVLIKGSKDGLLFLLNDEVDFESVLQELSYKLDEANGDFFQGPLTHVRIQLGGRQLTSEVEKRLQQVVERCGNLVIQEMISDVSAPHASGRPCVTFQVVCGTIRSGQSRYFDQNVLLLGDVNPGGTLASAGDVVVLGALRGLAHAGYTGDRERLIAASYLRPMQLRIADLVSRAPENWPESTSVMQYAYLKGNHVVVEDIQHLDKLRPELSLYDRNGSARV